MTMLAKRLRRLRELNDLEQLEIAELVGITIYSYQKYEYSTATPRLPQLVKLAQFYGVTLDYLVGLQDECISENTISDKDKQFFNEYLTLPTELKEVVVDVVKALNKTKTVNKI